MKSKAALPGDSRSNRQKAALTGDKIKQRIFDP
jgi:hypothetical protein